MSIRYKFIFGFFVALFLVLVIKLYYLSIKQHRYFDKLSERNSTKTEVIIPIRGQIIDRVGEPLAINELGFSIYLSPGLRKNQTALDSELKLISQNFPALNMDELKKEYLAKDSYYNHLPILIARFIKHSDMQRVFARLVQSENIIVRPSTKRQYPNRSIGSHILGYVGAADSRDIEKNPISRHTGVMGKTGLERQYNNFLQGEIGFKKTKVSALNKEIDVLEDEIGRAHV